MDAQAICSCESCVESRAFRERVDSLMRSLSLDDQHHVMVRSGGEKGIYYPASSHDTLDAAVAAAKKHKKPVYLVHLPMTVDRWSSFVSDMTGRFIIKHRIDTLNVAGNRDRAEDKGFHHDSTKGLLEEVLDDLRELEFLNVPVK